MPDYDPNVLPDGARRLLLGPIDSFEKLELLIALRGSDSSERLDALETRTGAPSVVLERALGELAAAGMVVKQAGRWRLIAADSDREAISELVEAWSNNRNAVLNVMTQRSLERIRASVARTFADAFKLRRGDKSEGGDDDG